jgi:hypothetical protein
MVVRRRQWAGGDVTQRDDFPIDETNVNVVLRNTVSGATQSFGPAQIHAEANQHTGLMVVTIATEQDPNGQQYVLSLDRWTIDIEPVRSSGGSCLVTTACVTALGKPDDCHELQMFRMMRDSYLRSNENGPEVIADYYRTAPLVVAAVDHSSDDEAWARVYETLVRPVTLLMDEGQVDEAARAAATVYESIKEEYGVR